MTKAKKKQKETPPATIGACSPGKDAPSGNSGPRAGEEAPRSVGCVETNSVTAGLEAADAMLKTAQVRLLASNPVCPGKYVTIVGGEVAEVNASVAAGSKAAADALVDAIVIPNVHRQVFDAFTASVSPEKLGAIGLIETFSLAAAIISGDQAVKSARVDLLEIRLGRALGGKAFVLLTGEVSAVRAAVDAAVQTARGQGVLLGSTVIPSPHPDLLKSLL